MRRMLVIAALIGLCLPTHVTFASDIFADALYASSRANLYNPQNAVGLPDGLSADFNGQDTYLVLDMGEESVSDATLVVSHYEIGASVFVEFQTSELNTLVSYGGYINQTGEWIASYQSQLPYRYVRITSHANKEWGLDAVQTSSYGVPGVEDDQVDDEQQQPIDGEVDALPVTGDLIKSPEYSSVYVLGADGKRHAFPNETVFFSWGFAFDDIVEISSEELAGYALGRNVTVKPATYLVKLQTNPKVYAVAPGSELRWITSESLAVSLYGVDWAQQVIDVSDALWSNYSVGDDIDRASDIEGWIIDEFPY